MRPDCSVKLRPSQAFISQAQCRAEWWEFSGEFCIEISWLLPAIAIEE